jgi:general secretion pathway protein J
MSRYSASSTAGFSLVELLASLAVLAMLSLMVLAGIGGRSVAWTRMDADSARGETIEAVQATLYDRLQHVWPVTLYNMAQPGPDFVGEATHLNMLATPPDARGAGPLRRYQLALDAGGDLVLDSLSDISLDQRHWSDRQVLLHGVRALDLAYFGQALKTPAPGWRSSWEQQAVMPSLIRIRLSFPAGDRRRWPDLIVHPMADIDAGCRLAVPAGGCKGR